VRRSEEKLQHRVTRHITLKPLHERFGLISKLCATRADPRQRRILARIKLGQCVLAFPIS
jgi:hypothetical protein